MALICRWFGAIGVEFRLAEAFDYGTDTLFDDNAEIESGGVSLLISKVLNFEKFFHFVLLLGLVG